MLCTKPSRFRGCKSPMGRGFWEPPGDESPGAVTLFQGLVELPFKSLGMKASWAAFGDSSLQTVGADGFAEMSGTACSTWRGLEDGGSDAMVAGQEGWAVGVRSLSLQNQPGGGDVLWREEEGKSWPPLRLSGCGACSVLREWRNSYVAAQLTRSTLPCLKRGRNLNPWVTSKKLWED